MISSFVEEVVEGASEWRAGSQALAFLIKLQIMNWPLQGAKFLFDFVSLPDQRGIYQFLILLSSRIYLSCYC